MKSMHTALVVLACAGLLGGCASAQRPIKTEAALGRVIVYRNGVAYFERRAEVHGDKLTLTVPAERVDDFLKSLRIEDAATGKSLPVSFPTSEARGDEVEMTITLPKPVPRVLRVAYVTESPAWKPSYRLTLGKGGAARLQAWAIVDNVSGEDWKHVTVGVGSTSALSFRYDLHSVRVVERETLGGDTAFAAAPPTGGSPYKVPNGEAQVVANLALDDVDGISDGDKKPRRTAEYDAREKSGAAVRRTGAPAHEPNAGATAKPSTAPKDNVRQIAQRLRANKQKVKIEGYARAGERDTRQSSIDRANAVRDELIANGVPPAQVEAVGTGRVSNAQGVRLVTAAAPDQPQQAKSADASDSNEPIGSAYFVAPVPLTIEKDHSAMVSILSTTTKAEPVYFYDPISERGSKRYAFNAVRLDNPSRYTLDSGPFTVYAEGQFLGEGLSEPIPPKSTAFIPYALDRKLVIEPVIDTREEIDRLVTIERGVVTTEAEHVRRTKLAIANRGATAARVFVRHALPEGWTLRKKGRFEKLGGAYLLPVDVPPHDAVNVEIEESQPFQKSIDIQTDTGLGDIALFLRSAHAVSPELQGKLDEIVKMHRELRDKEDRIATLHRQMGDYRQRVDEIHVQLVTLRKVPNAQKLSSYLAKKMQEISDRIQQATMDVTDLEGQVLTTRIALEDRVAELSLAPKTEKVAKADGATP